MKAIVTYRIFVRYLFTKIVTTGSVIMARAMDDYMEAELDPGISRGYLEAIATNIRVAMENMGLISYSPLNASDRRVKYICPTNKFKTVMYKGSDRVDVTIMIQAVAYKALKRGYKHRKW